MPFSTTHEQWFVTDKYIIYTKLTHRFCTPHMIRSMMVPSSGAPIRKLTDVPITNILAVVIPDIDTDTDN